MVGAALPAQKTTAELPGGPKPSPVWRGPAEEEVTEFGETGEEEIWQGEEPVPTTPARPAPPPAAPRPWYFSVLRLLFPLIFFAVPLLNLLFRNSPFGSDQNPAPVLRRAVFCTSVSNGRPVQPKTNFSIREDRRVVLFTAWKGSAKDHRFSIRWYTPRGEPYPATPSIRFQPGDQEFLGDASLLLEERMPLGRWRAEIAVDERTVNRSSFELRE
jgi:hypothetical protein